MTDDWTPAGDDQPPICACGVTALPASPRHVIDCSFVCDNPDCDAYGEIVTTSTETSWPP